MSQAGGAITTKVLRWREASEAERAARLKRPAISHQAELTSGVRATIADVRARGDGAVRALTERFDRVTLPNAKVTAAEIETAVAQVGGQFRADLTEAIRRVSLFHEAQRPQAISVETGVGTRCERRWVPIERVGLFCRLSPMGFPSTY